MLEVEADGVRGEAFGFEGPAAEPEPGVEGVAGAEEEEPEGGSLAET